MMDLSGNQAGIISLNQQSFDIAYHINYLGDDPLVSAAIDEYLMVGFYMVDYYLYKEN